MPDITVMSWNIENFGNGFNPAGGDILGRYRGNYVAFCNFIAQVVFQQNADILMLMELRQGGVAHLGTLQVALNNAFGGAGNWYYDWIKGAIAANAAPGPNFNITNSGQLDWAQSAHYEGYALFWNQNPAKFSMVQAPHILPPGAAPVANTMSSGVQPAPPAPLPPGIPTHCLSLVMEGRGPLIVPWPWPYVAPGPGMGYVWQDLNFPTGWVANHPSRNSSRRPCYSVIDLNIAGPPSPAQKLVPIIFFHAPSNGSNPDSPAAGTLLAGYSRQMFQAQDQAAGWGWLDSAKVIASGDFNVDGNPAVLPANRQEAYQAYTLPFGTAPATGAQCAPQIVLGAGLPFNNVPPVCTIIQLNVNAKGTGPPIVSANPSDYRRSELDNVFYRGFVNTPAPVQGIVYDLPLAVMAGGTLIGAPVTAFVPTVAAAAVAPGIVMAGGRPVFARNHTRALYPKIQNYANFLNELNNGVFASARTASEFIRLFISDHLPVSFRFIV